MLCHIFVRTFGYLEVGQYQIPAASIWFEIWGVVDLGQKFFDFSRKFPKSFDFSGNLTQKIRFSRQISEKFRFF